MKIVASTMQSRVENFTEAVEWYTKLLGRAADFVPGDGIAEWELYSNCWLAVIKARPDPGRNRIRFGVADLQLEAGRIQQLGVAVTEPVVVAEIVAYCDFDDPYGNRLGLFQDLQHHPWPAV